MHVLCKNCRLNGLHKLAELSVEILFLEWDIILFSETRAESQIADLDGGHRLYLHRDEYYASGVGILIHASLVNNIRSVHYISDRILRVDLHFAQRKISFIAVYVPHAGFSLEFLEQTYDQLHQALTNANRTGHTIVIGGDFNSQWGIGLRGQKMAEMAAAFNLSLVNGNGNGRDEDSWTFRSSLGYLRRIDFIFASSSLHSLAHGTSNHLDLGSDHRAVFVEFSITKITRWQNKERRCSMRGWAPFDNGQSFQTALDEKLRRRQPKSLFEAETILFDTAAIQGESACGKRRRFNDLPWDTPYFQNLLQQKRRPDTRPAKNANIFRKKYGNMCANI